MQYGRDYSRLYDIFYQSKSYDAEARFVLERNARWTDATPSRIIDFGCGTGRHVFEFAKIADHVLGIDQSEEMLTLAREKLDGEFRALGERVSFQHGDIRTHDARAPVNLAVCLFHVLCYLRTHEDLLSALSNARAQLAAGGLYLFDFWYGPAVLANPPSQRSIAFETDQTRGTRSSRPTWIEDQQTVRVDYAIEEVDLNSGDTRRYSEEHVVRYMFEDEVRGLLRAAGFEVLELAEWMSAAPVSEESFSAYVLARPHPTSR